jgi:hypothetical protein
MTRVPTFASAQAKGTVGGGKTKRREPDALAFLIFLLDYSTFDWNFGAIWQLYIC